MCSCRVALVGSSVVIYDTMHLLSVLSACFVIYVHKYQNQQFDLLTVSYCANMSNNCSFLCITSQNRFHFVCHFVSHLQVIIISIVSLYWEFSEAIASVPGA